MKQNIQIQQSFGSALVRLQSHLINSFKLLQDTMQHSIEELHLKTSLMEDRILDILHHKEKVILKLSNSLDSLKTNFSSLEDTMVTLANSKAADSYSVIDAHVNIKIEKFIRQEREKMGELEAEVLKLETRLETKIEKDLTHRLGKNNLELMKNRIDSLEVKVEDSSKPISNYNSGDVSSIRQELKEINKLVTKIVEDSNRHQNKIKQIEEQSFRTTPNNTIDRNSHNKEHLHPHNKYQTSDYNQGPRLNFNDYERDFAPEEMEVGLRGLRKSKEKRESNDRLINNSGVSKNNLPPMPSGKPPTKKDLPPLSKQKPIKEIPKPSQLPSKQQIEEQLGEIYVDEEGYLMDAEGNYLRDGEGNLIDAQGLSAQQDNDQY